MSHGEDSGSQTKPRQSKVLQCPLCTAPYDTGDHEAKLLSCHHSFCLGCLALRAEGRQLFRCPDAECRRKISVPPGGAGDFPTNFYVAQMRGLLAPGPGGKSQYTKGATCQKHLEQPLLFFCETCMVAICMNCTVLDHKEVSGHKIIDISAAIEGHQEVLNSRVSQVAMALERNKETMTTLRSELRNLEIAKSVAAEQIIHGFDEMRAVMEQRQTDLIKMAEQYYNDRKATVIAHAQHHKAHNEQLEELKEAITVSVQGPTVSESIQAANNVQLMGRIGDLCEPRPLELQHPGFIQFKQNNMLKTFTNTMGSLGSVQCKHALPSVIDIEPGEATSSLKSMVKLTVQSAQGIPLDNYPLNAEIIDPCGDRLHTKVTFLEGGYHVLEYRPQMPGKHQLRLRFMGKAMWGTEREILVKSNDPVMKIGGSTADGTQLHRPTSVAVHHVTGKIYVADMGNKRVLMYSAAGKLLGHFKIGGSKATTYDIAINAATEEVYCTKVGPDETGHVLGRTIRCFSLAGAPSHQFTNQEMRKALFLTVNSKGQVIASDSIANCVYIYSKEGLQLKKIGGSKAGNRPGEFNFPSALCTGKDDSIIVLDTGNHRVQVFSRSGKFLHQFGEEGQKKGQFKSPRGVAADRHGNILVADSRNRIQVLRHDGTFVSCIDSSGDKINEPYNMAVTTDGHVFMADFKNDCIKKYEYL